MSSTGAPNDNPIILNIMPTQGCILLGTLFAQSLWAISTLQICIYFKNYERDKLALKLLVLTLWLTDTANQVLIAKSTFLVIQKFGSIAVIEESSLEILLSLLTSAIVIFAVQIYYVRRVYLFAGKRLWVMTLVIIWVILAIWQIVAATAYFIMIVGKPLALQSHPLYVNMNLATRLAAVIVDTTLALCMVWLLAHKNQARIPKTRQMVHRIILVMINSGVWTALFASIVLILGKIFPRDLYHVIFLFPICSLYLNSFLANLITRNYIRGDNSVHSTFGLRTPMGPITTLEFQDIRLITQTTSMTAPSHVVVNKQTIDFSVNPRSYDTKSNGMLDGV